MIRMHLHDSSVTWQREVVASEISRYSGSMGRISDGIMTVLLDEIMGHLMEVLIPGFVTSIGDVEGKYFPPDMELCHLVTIVIG